MPLSDSVLTEIRDTLTQLLAEIRLLRQEFQAALTPPTPPAGPAAKAPAKKKAAR